MADHGATRRPFTTSTSAMIPLQDDDNSKNSTEKNLSFSFNFIWPFGIPSTPETATARIIRNIVNFKLYYWQFMWLVLFISLIPQRKVSLVYLVIMKEITLMYLLLLHALPSSVLLHKIIDKRVVMFMVSLITANMMISTNAGVHLVASVGGTIPVILLHAVLWKSENFVVSKGGSVDEELVQLVDNKDSDANPIENC